MFEAFKLAERAFDEDEIPVGAVIVKDGKIIGRGYNQKEKFKNPLKHAELVAIEEACNFIGDWRLNDCEIYVTLKPCSMCLGAIKETRIKKIVYGIERNEQTNLNSDLECIIGGVLQKDCLEILQKFFKKKRNK